MSNRRRSCRGIQISASNSRKRRRRKRGKGENPHKHQHQQRQRQQTKIYTYLDKDLVQIHSRNTDPQTASITIPENQLMHFMHAPKTGFIRLKPSFRTEHLHVFAINRIQLHAPGIQPDKCSAGDDVAVDNVAFGRDFALPQLRYGWEPAETF